MTALISPFLALLISLWLISIGTGLQGTLLGMRADLESFNIIATGTVMASYFMGFIISFFLTPKIINEVGHIRSFSAFASIASAATLAHAVFVDPYSWFVFRIITGVCIGGLTMVGESWLNVATSNENRGKIYAIYMIVILSASAFSQILVNLTAVTGYDLFVLVSISLSVSLVPLALGARIRAPEIQQAPRLGIGKLIHRSPLGTMGIFVSGVVNGAIWSMMAVYGIRIGLTIQEISIFMFVIIGGGLLSLWPVGRISDVVDRRKVILVISVASMVVCAVFTLAENFQAYWIYILGGIFGFCAFPLYGIAGSHINDYLEKDEFVPACGSMVLLYGSGAILSPLATAVAMEMLQAQGMFIFLGIVELGIVIYTIIRILKGAPLSAEERSETVMEMPKVSPMVSPLDPRNEDAEALSEEYQSEEVQDENLPDPDDMSPEAS